MKNKKIHYTHPSITDLEIKYVNDAITNGWGEKCYEYITKLEDLFKDYLGVKHAIATSSCTGALHMGLNALNISSGDEIIVADINWVATVAPIFHLGATPVYVDILKDSWCIDPNKVRAAINSKTKAIIAVHLYGNLCNMNELLEISKLKGYWDISKVIYEKHGSRRSNSRKRIKSQKLKKEQNNFKQYELNLNI